MKYAFFDDEMSMNTKTNAFSWKYPRVEDF